MSSGKAWKKIKKKVNQRSEALLTSLKKRETISSTDEHWLDNICIVGLDLRVPVFSHGQLNARLIQKPHSNFHANGELNNLLLLLDQEDMRRSIWHNDETWTCDEKC
jgi:hypothetical protein